MTQTQNITAAEQARRDNEDFDSLMLRLSSWGTKAEEIAEMRATCAAQTN